MEPSESKTAEPAGPLTGTAAIEPPRDAEPAPPAGVGAAGLARLLGLCILALITWMTPLAQGPGFSYDDREAIVGNPVVEGEVPLRTAFTQDYWHHLEDAGHYRPLATVLLAMDRARSEQADPIRFRTTNVLLHVIVLALLGLASLRLAARWKAPAPWFGLIVFAMHPISADVVAWISGRTSLVSGFGAAAGLLTISYVHPAGRARGRVAFFGAALGALVALMGKEDGLVVAAVLPVLAYLLGGPRAGIGGAAGAVLAVSAACWLRTAALGSAMPSSPAPVLEGIPLLERLTTGAGAWGSGLIQLVTPWRATPPGLEPSDISGLHGGLWLGVLGIASWSLLRGGRSPEGMKPSPRARPALLSLGAVLVSVLPLIQLVPAGELFAPRFMYQPLLLGTFLVSWAAFHLFRPLGRWSIAVKVIACAGLMAYAATTGSARYQSRLSYWESHLPAHEGSAKVWNAIGQARQEARDDSGARAAYRRSIDIDDSYGAPWAKLGELELRADDLLMAEAYLRRAIAEDPSAVVARANLARAVLSAGDPEEAARFYREAIELAPGRAALHRGLARALLAGGQRDAAEAAVTRALALSPGDRLSVRLAAKIEASAEGDQ